MTRQPVVRAEIEEGREAADFTMIQSVTAGQPIEVSRHGDEVVRRMMDQTAAAGRVFAGYVSCGSRLRK